MNTNNQLPGWVPEPKRHMATLFFLLDEYLNDLKIDLDRLMDAAVEFASSRARKWRYDPEDWGEEDPGQVYDLLIKPNGTHEQMGLAGKSFVITLLAVRSRSKSRKRWR